MERDDRQDVLVMALFVVAKDVVLDCAGELGLSEEQVTDEMFSAVKKEVGKVLGDWRESVKDIIKNTIGNNMPEETDSECPLHLTCSAACPFMQIGGCRLPDRAEKKIE